MNERNNQFGPGDLSERKEESWSPALDEYEKEMEKIVKIKDQIARIKKTIEDEKIKEGTPARVEMEEEMAWRERKIQEAQNRAELKLKEHESLIKPMRNLDSDRMGNA